MTLNEYQAAALKPARKDLSHEMSLATRTLGLTGEAGEVADHVKKALGHGHPLDRAKLAKELGDTLWYIAALAEELGLCLDDIATGNIRKLEARYPDGFSTQASLERVDVAREAAVYEDR